MRIIAGKFKRRALVTTPGAEITRPTSDRVRESVFNIVTSEIPGAIVLDLFAGSGALGFEALSRGAEKVVFVEQNKEALKALRANIQALGILESQALVVPCSVEAFLQNSQAYLQPPKAQESFAASAELIFADPPYDSPWYSEALKALVQSGLLSKNALCVLEMSGSRPKSDIGPEENMPHAEGSTREGASTQKWECESRRKYGKTRVEFWRWEDS
jgi:16S rRNA (guanine966-N2)-methyltransferase